MLAAVLLAGNLFSAGLAGKADAQRAGGPAPLVFDFTGSLEQHRLDKAVAVLARAETRRQARLERRRRQLRALKPFQELPPGVSRATLESIASCESGGDPGIVSSSGLYHGKYQFSTATWAAVGGSGLPSQAPEVEQDFRAALLYVRSGPGQWPVCGS